MGPLNQGDEEDSRPDQGDPLLLAWRRWASRQRGDGCQISDPDRKQGETKTADVGFETLLPIASGEMRPGCRHPTARAANPQQNAHRAGRQSQLVVGA